MNVLLRLILLVFLAFSGQSNATTTAVTYGYVANTVQLGVENLNNNGLINPSGCCSKLSARDSQDRAQARDFFALSTGFVVPKGLADDLLDQADLDRLAMAATPAVKQLIIKHAPVAELAQLALREGMRSLRQNGIEKVLAGLTDVAQVHRVCSR